MTALLDILAESVTIRDSDGRLVYGNRAALTSMGFSTLAELRRQDSRAIMGSYEVEDEHGRPLTIEDLPGIKLLAGEQPEPLLMRVVDGDGNVAWRLLKTTPVRGRRGRFIGAMTVIEDVTAVKAAELSTRLLAESGRILASSLEHQQTLKNVAQVAVPAIADYCVVDLLDEHGFLERVAAAHRDPARRDLVAALESVDRHLPDPLTAAGRVILTGTSELYDRMSAEELAASSPGPGDIDLIRELGVRSGALVPMRVPHRTIGLLTLVTSDSKRRLTGEDVELAEELGRRAAVAVENSRLHTKLAGIALTLQQSLHPSALPEIPGWRAAAIYQPAPSELRVDVGGDFYEVFEADGGWFVIVGDVTGKGVGAASMTALMRHGARVASRAEPEPAAILQRLHEALMQQSEPSFCTAICLALREDHVLISSAGHPPALLVGGAAGDLRRRPRAGPILGAFDDAQWPQELIELSPEELIVLYTDGVTETRGQDGLFGAERLQAFAREHEREAPGAFLDQLARTLDGFRHGPPRDDVAALAFRLGEAR